MGVATARALGELYSSPLNDRDLFLAAQAWETVFHGNPSGVDVAAAVSSGAIRFSRVEEPEPIVLGAPLELVVAQAGPPASTREMVEGVARLKERSPAQFNRTLEAIASLVENALLLLRSADFGAIGKLMDLNQMLLAGWMLSTEEIERACRLSREAGALGAKLTGAGGGGCVIALSGHAGAADTKLRTEAIQAALNNAKIPSFAACLAAPSAEKDILS
jgi:mevalonate kinase